VDEVLRWFAEENIEYLNAVPNIVWGEGKTAETRLFAPGLPGGRLEHLLCQMGWALTHGQEGGLFVLIGRRQANPLTEPVPFHSSTTGTLLQSLTNRKADSDAAE
jgi:hypothetical protein